MFDGGGKWSKIKNAKLACKKYFCCIETELLVIGYSYFWEYLSYIC